MRQFKADVIPEGIVIVDRQGREWIRGPEYQDENMSGRGWLQLEYNGEVMAFPDVVNLYGFLDDKGQRFLVVASGYPS